MSIELEIEVVLELWNTVRDVIPAKHRDEVAEDFLRVFENFGVEPEELSAVTDEDRNLSNAYKNMYGEELEEEQDDNDNYNDEDY